MKEKTAVRIIIRGSIAAVLTVLFLTGLPQYYIVSLVTESDEYSFGGPSSLTACPEEWDEWYSRFHPDKKEPTNEYKLEHFGISLTAPAPADKEGIYKRWGDNCWQWYSADKEHAYNIYLVAPDEFFTNTDESSSFLPDPHLRMIWELNEEDHDQSWILSKPVTRKGLNRLASHLDLNSADHKYDFEHIMYSVTPDNCPIFSARAARAYLYCLIEKSYYMETQFHFDNDSVKGFVGSFPRNGKPDNRGVYYSFLWLYSEKDLDHCYYLYIHTMDLDDMCYIIDSLGNSEV